MAKKKANKKVNLSLSLPTTNFTMKDVFNSMLVGVDKIAPNLGLKFVMKMFLGSTTSDIESNVEQDGNKVWCDLHPDKSSIPFEYGVMIVSGCNSKDLAYGEPRRAELIKEFDECAHVRHMAFLTTTTFDKRGYITRIYANVEDNKCKELGIEFIKEEEYNENTGLESV